LSLWHFHGELADTATAWHPVGVAASLLPSQERRAHLDALKQLTEAEGRDSSALIISYKASLYDAGISIAGQVPPALRRRAGTDRRRYSS
jgi:hypothetical protein